MSHEEIAIALRITRPTLEKYYEAELSIGALERRMDALAAMHRTACKGNVAAQKAYLAMNPQVAAPPLPKSAQKPEPKGKKEQANEDATTAAAGTEWADLLPAGGKVVPIRA